MNRDPKSLLLPRERQPTSTLRRFATLPLGAEVAGFFETPNGTIFFNVQHPMEGLSPNPVNNSLPGGIGRATVGVVDGLDIRELSGDFAPLSVALTETDKTTVRVAAGRYRALAQEGQTFGGLIPPGLGAIPSFDGTTVLNEDSIASGLAPESAHPIRPNFFSEALRSDMPDLNALVLEPGLTRRGYLFTAWESRPSTMSRMAVYRDAAGLWHVKDTDVQLVDFTQNGMRGAWHLCSGSVSPWQTPLANEEFFADKDLQNWNRPDPRNKTFARAYGGAIYLNPSISEIAFIDNRDDGLQQFAHRLLDNVDEWPNPYRYGYVIEVTAPMSARPIPKKRYALGRFTHEVALVMPDRRTVYMTSDDQPGGFFKFVADRADTLESGTLYAARLSRDHAALNPEMPAFDVTWIALGRASETEISILIKRYDHVSLKPIDDVETSYVTQHEIDEYAREFRRHGSAKNSALAFIETTAIAKALGATVELYGVEGLTANYARLQQAVEDGEHPRMYMAASYVRGTAADQEGDLRLRENQCGAVYSLEADASFNVIRMETLIDGGPYDTGNVNRCDVDNIAQPDNLLELSDGRLLIGEDTPNHLNNAIWIYTSQPQGRDVRE